MSTAFIFMEVYPGCWKSGAALARGALSSKFLATMADFFNRGENVQYWPALPPHCALDDGANDRSQTRNRISVMESRVTQLRIAPARHKAPPAAGIFGFTKSDAHAMRHGEASTRPPRTHLSIAA
jgi:hypothetical protein